MTSRALLVARTLALCSLSLLVPVAVFAAQSAAPAAPASPWWPPSPLEVALAWPVLTGIASLVYSKLDANSRAHAIFAMLASVGLDLPALGASISKAVTGKYTLGAKARAASIASSGLVLVALVVALSGCSWLKGGGGAQIATDVGQVAACVIAQAESETGPVDPGAIASACSGAAVADVIAIVGQLLASGNLPAPVAARLQAIKAGAR